MAYSIQEHARPGHLPQQQLDLGAQFDHVFWAGDLNYRQEMKSWWIANEDRLKGKPADSIDGQTRLTDASKTGRRLMHLKKVLLNRHPLACMQHHRRLDE
eukprot:SAG31_NODE_337_length_17493_cov_5.855755_1_plen_100_part_00